MGLGFVPLFLATLLYKPCTAAYLQKPSMSPSNVALTWGSVPLLHGDVDNQNSRVIYQAVDSTHLLESLVESVSKGVSGGDAAAQAALVFVGHKIRLQHLSASTSRAAVKPLQDAISLAQHTVSMPTFQHEAAQPLERSVLSFLQGKVPSIQTAGSCSDATLSNSPAQAVQQLSSTPTSGPKVLLVCGSADADLASEAASVSQYSQALAAAFEKHTVAYVSDAQNQVSETLNTSRALLQTMELPAGISGLQLPSYAALTQASDEYLCDDKCFTQVRVIEVFILFVTLLTALLSGICMMNVLGTPSKFETVKEARHQES